MNLIIFFYKEKELSMKSYYYQSFKTKDYGKVELFLKSARIDIIDESITNKNVITSINIPFNFMGLIYIANIEQINQILFFLLNKIKIDKNKDNILSEEELKKIFLELLTKIKYEDDKINIELNPKDYERFYAQIFFLEKIQIVSDTIRFNYFLSDFNKNPKIVAVVNDNDNGIYKTPHSINKNKIIFYNDINYHKLLLLSQNNNNYKIKFSMPEISMIFNDYEKQLNHCIDKELFIYLYQNNFMDWDFYILHYLFFQKNFRLFIGRVLSINNNYNLFLTKKIINIENNKIEFSPIINFKEEEKEMSNAINNSYKKYYLINNNHFSGIGINENDYEYIFSNLIEGKINICKLKSYTLYAFINNINKPKIYEFNFNFKQMRILYFKSLFNDFDLFLKRLLFIKNENIYFDYSFLESYYSMTNNEIHELFYRTNQSDQEQKKEDENSIINSIIIKIREPHIEIIRNDKDDKENFNVSLFHMELDKDLMKIMLYSEYNKWIKIIDKNKSLFNINNIIEYEETKVKRIKRKSVMKGKKKDFQSAFMQFLRLSSPDLNSPQK